MLGPLTAAESIPTDGNVIFSSCEIHCSGLSTKEGEWLVQSNPVLKTILPDQNLCFVKNSSSLFTKFTIKKGLFSHTALLI